MIRFLSLFSGIEAASVAWLPLGWTCVAVSEIEAFPCAVLRHHYPDVPNLGDVTQFKEWPDADFDVLVGGSPCQSFSIAGLRRGLDDPRGNLTLTYLAVVDRYRPRWVVWENVPGVLSIDGGRTFGAFLYALGKLGYGFAYRVLDAQYFGVPQRRRRVFVVGYLGDWRLAAAVLFERASLRGDHPPRRKSGQSVAPTISVRTRGGGGLGTDFDCDGGLIAGTVSSKWAKGTGGPTGDECYNLVSFAIQAGATRENPESGPDGVGVQRDIAYTLEARPEVQVVAFDTTQITSAGNYSAPKPGDPCHPLAAGAHPPAIAFPQNLSGTQHAATADQSPCLGAKNPTAVAYGFQPRIARNGRGAMGDVVGALSAESGKTGKGDAAPCVAVGYEVRRLLPEECEILMGLPRNYTRIPWKGRPAEKCPDGPRYRALGNSMCTPVVAWIGRRINAALAAQDKQRVA
jgi:DNA (cytosine-5)-methyltransferase 1